MKGGQYNDVLANDTFMVAVVKRLNYMTFGWWILLAALLKENFILSFSNFKTLLNSFGKSFL